MLRSEQLAKQSPAVEQSHKTGVMKCLPKQAHCLVHFPSSSLSVSLSLALLLNSPLKLKASLVLSTEEWMQVERRLFLFHLGEKMSLLLPVVGTELTVLSYWGQIQYVSPSSQHFHFFQTKRCLPILFSSHTTKHCHLSCSTLQSMKEKHKLKSKIEPGWREGDKKTCCSFIRPNYLLRETTQ